MINLDTIRLTNATYAISIDFIIDCFYFPLCVVLEFFHYGFSVVVYIIIDFNIFKIVVMCNSLPVHQKFINYI